MLGICKLKDRKLVLDPLVKKEDYLFYLKGKEIIEYAQKEAEGIIEEAKRIYMKEKERGYREGIEQGKREMTEQMMEMMARSINFFSSVEKEMVKIVIKAIEKILGEVEEETLIIKIIKNALAAARGEKRVIVRVAANKVDVVKRRINEILAQFPVISFIDVVPDPRVKDCGCIVESEIGVIDATLDSQLKAIENALKRSF